MRESVDTISQVGESEVATSVTDKRRRFNLNFRKIGVLTTVVAFGTGAFLLHNKLENDREEKANENVESVLLSKGWDESTFDVRKSGRELVLQCINGTGIERSFDIEVNNNFTEISIEVSTTTVDNKGRPIFKEEAQYDAYTDEAQEYLAQIQNSFCTN